VSTKRRTDPAGELARLTERRDHLHGLLETVVEAGSELDLSTTLRRIVQAAEMLVDAEYGALVLTGATGPAVQVHRSGDRQNQRPASPPDERLPAGEPAAGTFLAVPLRTGDEVLGTLYLTEKRDGDFTEDDEALLRALAATAGVAVANARLYEESRRRERWLDAAAEITRALLAGDPVEQVLSMVASRTRELSGADCAMVLVPSAEAPDEVLRVAAVDGPEAGVLGRALFPMADSVVGQVFRTGRGMRFEDLSTRNPADPRLKLSTVYGPALFMPMASRGEPIGTLIVLRVHGAPAFPADVGAVIESFARQASLALQLAETQRAAGRLALLEERERVAVDLQDNVIQRVFASGLLLDSVARRIESPELRARLERAAEGLDQTIRDTRRTIHSLQADAHPERPRLRQRLLGAVAEATAGHDLQPAVSLEGPLDALVPAQFAEHAVHVVRETVSDLARRGARSVSVTATASDMLTVRVTGDVPCRRLRTGRLRSATRCAEEFGGALRCEASASDGCEVVWTVPL
jgi:GAF domain-containing protein